MHFAVFVFKQYLHIWQTYSRGNTGVWMTNKLKLKVIQSMKSIFLILRMRKHCGKLIYWQETLFCRLLWILSPLLRCQWIQGGLWCKPTIGYELGMATILCIHTLPKNMDCNTVVNVTDWRKYQSVRYQCHKM